MKDVDYLIGKVVDKMGRLRCKAERLKARGRKNDLEEALGIKKQLADLEIFLASGGVRLRESPAGVSWYKITPAEPEARGTEGPGGDRHGEAGQVEGTIPSPEESRPSDRLPREGAYPDTITTRETVK